METCAPYLEFEGLCDRKQQYEVRSPSLALIKAYFSPAGTRLNLRSDTGGVRFRRLSHLIAAEQA